MAMILPSFLCSLKILSLACTLRPSPAEDFATSGDRNNQAISNLSHSFAWLSDFLLLVVVVFIVVLLGLFL